MLSTHTWSLNRSRDKNKDGALSQLPPSFEPNPPCRLLTKGYFIPEANYRDHLQCRWFKVLVADVVVDVGLLLYGCSLLVLTTQPHTVCLLHMRCNNPGLSQTVFLWRTYCSRDWMQLIGNTYRLSRQYRVPCNWLVSLTVYPSSTGYHTWHYTWQQWRLWCGTLRCTLLVYTEIY